MEGIHFFNEYLRTHNYTLYVIGPDSSALDGYERDYVQACHQLADDQVIFLGELQHEEALSYFSKAKFLIHLSRQEGMPNVVLEAMAYAVFPIISDMDGLANELISQNKSGINIDCVDGIKLPLLMFSNNEGRKAVISNHSFEVVASQTMDVYFGKQQ
ncbi:hypothetical protein GCM10022394_14250 [Zobellella aerophila]|uniref:Glycosyl transferase family 1 domain-containing protein n=1 Tax=Zobellella aerophila TaxID=870480 RepID=A0ABP6VL21_9GAMM